MTTVDGGSTRAPGNAGARKLMISTPASPSTMLTRPRSLSVSLGLIAVVTAGVILLTILLLRQPQVGQGELGIPQDAAHVILERVGETSLGGELVATPEHATRSPLSQQMSLLVVDQHELAVGACVVEECARDSRRVLGTTNEKGELVVFLEKSLDVTTLHVHHPSFIPAVVQLSTPLPERNTVHLRPGRGLSGAVALADGSPAGPGIRVLAWPVSEPWPLNARNPQDQCLLPIAVTDDSGRFELLCLPTSIAYWVEAAGNGLVTQVRYRGIPPDTRDLYLRVYPCYACIVRPRDEQGRPPRGDVNLGVSGRPTSWMCSPHPCDTIELSEPVQVLLGIDTSSVRHAWPPRDTLICLIALGQEGEPPGVQFLASYPGYSSEAVFVQARRIDSPIPEYVVPLHCDTEQWGRCELRFSNMLAETLPTEFQRSRYGQVFLEAADGRRLVFGIRRLAESKPIVITGIPFGTYEVTFRDLLGFISTRIEGPAENNGALVIDEKPAELEVFLPDVGGFLLELRDPEGQQYSGELLLGLEKKGSGTRVNLGFPSTPYCEDMLPEGTYELTMFLPKQLPLVFFGRREFVIQAGMLTRLSSTMH
ncbi:MAG: DUF2590 family protein [Planctomycetota bacterium]|nr:MAG: DUF2590 family protein [Planctomycetota bacterium]